MYVQELSFRLPKLGKLQKNKSMKNIKAVVKCTSEADTTIVIFLEHLNKIIQKSNY